MDTLRLEDKNHSPYLIFQLSFVIPEQTPNRSVAHASTSPTRMEGKVSRYSQSCAAELEERLIDFAVLIIKLSGSLPRSAAGKHIGS